MLMNIDPPEAPALALPPVSIEAAAVAYGGRCVLEDIDLRIAPGERVAVIGPSGAGKTTLFRLIAGLVKPAAGRALNPG